MKSKYTPELVELIVQAIEATGSDTDACKIAGISRECFYSYVRKFPDFEHRVKAAHLFWRQHCPETLKREAIQQFERLVTGKAEVVTLTTEEWTHADGSTSCKTTRRVQNVLPPRYALERVLDVSKISADHQEVEEVSDLQITEQAIAALRGAMTADDVHSLTLSSALVKLMEYRRKINPPTAAKIVEMMLFDLEMTPQQIVEELKSQWLRASPTPPNADQN